MQQPVMKKLNNYLLCTLFIFLIIFVVFASIAKSLGLFTTQLLTLEHHAGGDHILHFSLSFLISYFSFWALPPSLKYKPLSIVNWSTLLLLLLVSTDEGLQYFFPTRQFSWFDMGANWSGILFGAILSYLTEKMFNWLKSKQRH